MKPNTTIFILVGVIILLIGLYFTLSKSKSYKWYETYQAADQNPYGNFALVELLKASSKRKLTIVKEPITKAFDASEIDAAYLYIAHDFQIDSSNRSHLLNFVEKGNSALIATNSPPHELLRNLPAYECGDNWENDNSAEGFIKDKSVLINFDHPELKYKKDISFEYVDRNKPKNYNWNYLDSASFCTLYPKINALGHFNDSLINFYRVKHGKGFFYFHTNPIVFTNYFFLTKHGKDYVEKAVSHINNKNIYWDEYNKNFTSPAKTERTESPLKFILGEDGLRAAWYLSITIILLYVIFFARRKQRVIPVFEMPTNSSLEFTETIGRLYFQQNNHQKLSILKIKFFLSFIRERYGISTNVIDSSFYQKLHLKSGIPLKNIELLFGQYQRIKSLNEIADDTLINFHQALEAFYQNCK